MNQIKVIMTNGGERIFASQAANQWYRGYVEGNGCLTVYREWDAGVCNGRIPEASFAPGIWRECVTEK